MREQKCPRKSANSVWETESLERHQLTSAIPYHNDRPASVSIPVADF
jgi:hypothetical protein